MDRLHLVALSALALVACDPAKQPHADSPEKAGSRVNAVQAVKHEAEKPQDFCDVYKEPGEAKKFAYPELDGEAPARKPGWTWVNLWATWCVPCIEEMPRLSKWEGELAAKGLGDVVFVSADNDAETVAKFREKHPQVPGTDGPRIKDVANLTPWVESLGLNGAALPVQIFVDGDDNIRCLRAGGVSEADRAAVERLLGT